MMLSLGSWLSDQLGPNRGLFMQAVAIVWLAGPAVMIVQAALGLWRRHRLLGDIVSVEGEVEEIHPSGFGESGVPSVVDLRVVYRHAGRAHEHWVTRTGPEAASFVIGSPIRLIHERGRPVNVLDASKRPWDDVIGPLVLALLLLGFMGWLLMFVTSLM